MSVRLSRRVLPAALLTALAAALGVGALLLPAPPLRPATAQAGRREPEPRLGPERAAPVALDPAAPEPPGRRAARALPPQAAAWRAAVQAGQREQVLSGALSLRRAPDGRAQLLALLEDEDPRVRAFALRELGRRQDPTLAPTFQAALGDADPYVAENARWGLSQLASGPRERRP